MGSRGTEPVGLREFYHSSYSHLCVLLTYAAGNLEEAEEVVQEAFARLVPRWSSVAAYDSPEAWVRRVALRILSNRRRHARSQRRLALQAPPPENVNGPDGTSIDLLRAMTALSIPQRQVVVLHYFADLSIESVAAELSIAPGTVKSRLSRARATLAPLLTEVSRHD